MKPLVGAFLIFAIASPAYADWEGIDWGMTEAQVEAANS